MNNAKKQGPVVRPQRPEGGQSPAPTAKTRKTREYLGWLQVTSKRYRQSQIKAAMAVNAEMLRFYFRLGGDIARMEASQPWGSGFLKRLSRDLKAQMPEANCFSVNSLIYMRCFHQLYASIVFTPQVGGRFDGGEEIFPQVGGKLGAEAEMDSLVFRVPWGHHKCIIDKFRKEPDKALFYVRETIKNGWSRAVLLHFIDTSLHERQGNAASNFADALPESDSDLAQEMTKDPYCFDFVALAPRYREKELKDAMMSHVEKFLLELGQGFMLVGREYRLEIGRKEAFADLLFFHMGLGRYIVVEVKTAEFEPEHLGQLGLYVSAVNHLLRKPGHGPTIGLLVCKTKDNTMVKWALESTRQPIGVSEYRIREVLPKEVASELPTVKELEAGLASD